MVSLLVFSDGWGIGSGWLVTGGGRFRGREGEGERGGQWDAWIFLEKEDEMGGESGDL